MGDEVLKEVLLSGEEVFHGHIINVEHWQVALPNGKTALREIAKHPGAAAIVPVDADGCVTLVRQYRVAVGRFTLEIPAGKLDRGEDPFFCAQRELEEETGLRAENWRLLTRIDTTPGFCTECISLYLATGLTQHKAHTDEDEFLNLVRIPLSEAVARVAAGELRDSKTAVGLLLAGNALSSVQKGAADYVPPIQRAGSAYASRRE